MTEPQNNPIERLKERKLNLGTLKFYEAGLKVLVRKPRALQTLPAQHRQAIRLYLLNKKQLTLRECGQKMGVNGERVRVLVAQGMDQLRRLTLS